MIAATPPEEMKTCRACRRMLPITSFTRRLKGSEKRRPRCKECRNEIKRRPRAVEQRKKLTKFAQQVDRRLDRPTALEAICNSAVYQFGGVDQLAKAVYAHIVDGPHATSARMTKCLVQLLIAADESRRRWEESLPDLSDEELEQETDRLAREVFEVVEVETFGD